MNLASRVDQYLRKRLAVGPWRLEGSSAGTYQGVVVIPALAEMDRLPLTLGDLADQDPAELAVWGIVVVVNHRVDADPVLQENNRRTLHWLRNEPLGDRLNLFWVDAVSPGCELPERHGGVGMARKIGADLALPLLSETGDPVLVYLDADTRVQPGYLKAIRRHFDSSALPAAVIPFRHQAGSSPEEEDAICRYELMLRCYVFGLKQAGSPYAFHTVGSTMACRVSAYLAIGGMNQRSVAEDFYFLQKLAKTGRGIGEVSGCVVFPSSRPSQRVPFGTGKAVMRQLAGEGSAGVYPLFLFRVLQDWLQLVAGHLSCSADEILTSADRLEPVLGDFLRQNRWLDVWPRLQNNHRMSGRLLQAFHEWFDGLKTLRLLHHLEGDVLRPAAEVAVPELLAWGGLPPEEKIEAQLAILRGEQNVPVEVS